MSCSSHLVSIYYSSRLFIYLVHFISPKTPWTASSSFSSHLVPLSNFIHLVSVSIFTILFLIVLLLYFRFFIILYFFIIRPLIIFFHYFVHFIWSRSPWAASSSSRSMFSSSYWAPFSNFICLSVSSYISQLVSFLYVL